MANLALETRSNPPAANGAPAPERWPKQAVLKDPEDEVPAPGTEEGFQSIYVVDNTFLGISRLFFRAPKRYAGPPPMYTAFCSCGKEMAKFGSRWYHREDASPAHRTGSGPMKFVIAL